MSQVFLIDGNSQMYRAYHAIRGLTGPDGRSTNAVYGFTTMLRKLIDEQKPDYIAASFDVAGPTFREELRADPSRVPAGISKTEWIERLINEEITEAVGFDMIVMGRQEGPDCYCYINNLLRSCLEKIGEQYRAVVIDNDDAVFVGEMLLVDNADNL